MDPSRASKVASKLNHKQAAQTQEAALGQKDLLGLVSEYRDLLKSNETPADAKGVLRKSKEGDARIAEILEKDPRVEMIARYQVLEETKVHAESVASQLDPDNSVNRQILYNLHQGIGRIEQRLNDIPKEGRTAFEAVNEYLLAQSKEDLNTGRIVKTPSVRKLIAKGRSALQQVGSLTLHGHTGGGKTEIARIIGKEHTGQDALLVRCYHGMPVSDFYGSHKLDSSEGANNLLEKIKKADALCSQYEKANTEATAEQKALAFQRIYSANAVTISEFVKGAVYTAAQNGRALILDEFNTIPDNIRLGLNDILTKKPGETLTIPETGETIVVKEGFCVIQTGNINYDKSAKDDKYTGRFTVEASQGERTGFLSVGNLPQQTKGGLAESKGVEQNELFLIALTACLNKDLSLTAAPCGLDKSAMESVWRLSQYAAVTQAAFAGRIDLASEFSFKADGVTPTNIKTNLQVSNRRLIRIVEAWKQSGTAASLDELVYDLVVKQSTNFHERKYLYQLAQKYNFFRPEEGWKVDTDFKSLGDFDALESVKNAAPLDVNERKKTLATVGKMQVLEAVYGAAPAESTTQVAKVLTTFNRQLTKLDEQIKKYGEELGNVCPR